MSIPSSVTRVRYLSAATGRLSTMPLLSSRVESSLCYRSGSLMVPLFPSYYFGFGWRLNNVVYARVTMSFPPQSIFTPLP
jgi:hypothetical protein